MQHEHIVAVVEPTPDGEGPLDLVRDVIRRGGRATVVVLLTKDAAGDIRAFAEAEDLGYREAVEIATDRLTATYAARVGGGAMSAVVSEDEHSGHTLFAAAQAARATSVALPQRLARRRGWRIPLERSDVPVVITPPRAA